VEVAVSAEPMAKRHSKPSVRSVFDYRADYDRPVQRVQFVSHSFKCQQTRISKRSMQGQPMRERKHRILLFHE